MDVLIFEEHSSVLPMLWARPREHRTLVCLDAHLDLQPVNPMRLARLKACQLQEQVEALEKPHHLLPDGEYCYSLEDWLYPAHALGLFHHLVWVVPPHVKVGFTREVFAHLRQMDGVHLEEIAGFRDVPTGGVAGTLAGVAITICSFRQLDGLGLRGDVVVDIDTDYFIEIPGDRPWVEPREVFEVLDRLLPQPSLVTISRSAGSGFLPLQSRYFADYLAALWQRREQDADHFGRLFAAQEMLRRGAQEAAAAALEQESRLRPGCAATWHLRALAETDAAASHAHRDKAAGLSEGYRTRILTLACSYPQRRLPIDARSYQELERLLLEESQTPAQRSAAQAAMGLILCAVGRIGAAIEKYAQCSAHFGTHPALALEIGKALAAHGNSAEAIGYFQAALQEDKSRTLAQLHLAEIHRASGRLEFALESADAAHRAAPAWGEVIVLLADIQRRLGHLSRSRHLAALHHAQEQQLERLILASGSVPVPD